MPRNRLTRQQLLGLLLTAIFGALCVLVVALTPRRQAPPDIYCRPDSTTTASPRRQRAAKPPNPRPAAPPPSRNHLDEPI